MNEDSIQAHEILERWFRSPVWNQICKDADDNDQDSVDLMDQINDHLQSLTFHLSNESGNDRISYEMRYFQQLCYDFDVNQYE